MTVLSADKEAVRSEGTQRAYPVYAGAVIYKGAIVVLGTHGYAIAGVDTANVRFVGMATEKKDNTDGGSGAISVVVDKSGEFQFATTGAVQAVVGNQMYVVDDATVNSTSSNSIKCGRVTEIISTTAVRVRIDIDVV